MNKYVKIFIFTILSSFNCLSGQTLTDSITRYHCISDTSIEYLIYLPSIKTQYKTSSFILFFDPHGNPSYPINLYRKTAAELGIGFIGFCNSKNGESFHAIASKFSIFWNDINSRFQIPTNHIAFCGFSGGAKVASALSLLYHPPLLIACGADPGISSDEFIRAQQQSIFIIGTRDFNFNILFALRQIYESSPLFHLLINRNKHQWPQPDDIKLAFYSFLLNNESITDNEKSQLIDKLKAILINRISQIDSHYDAMAKMDAINDAVFFLSPFLDISLFSQQAISLASDSAYIFNVIHFTEILKKSNDSQKELINALYTKDTIWWSEKIALMATDTSNNSDIILCDSQHRLFAFLGILLFSMTNQSIALRDLSSAAKYLWIYKKIEPSNPDMLLNYAKYYALTNNCFNCQLYLNQWISINQNNQNIILNDTIFARCLKQNSLGH